MQAIDYLVVGGGVVGLAVAAALSPFGSTAVMEKNSRLIDETSARNSGVVHAGIYYPMDSLKTTLCMRGNANIWRMNEQFPSLMRAKRIGKWIGACDDAELPALQDLMDRMDARRLPYERLSRSAITAQEPAVSMQEVVNSQNTGIVDVAALRDTLVCLLEEHEGVAMTHSEVVHVDISRGPRDGPLTATVLDRSRQRDNNGPENYAAEDTYQLQVNKAVVYATGLHHALAWERLTAGNTAVRAPASHTLHFCRGRYARYQGRTPVSRLVYPCPLPQLVGLGVHSVVDMAGGVTFGPDAVYVDRIDYHVEDEAEAFLDAQWKAVSRYIPSVQRERFVVDFCGIRPKLSGPGEPFRDFQMEELVSLDNGDAGTLRPRMESLTGSFDDTVGGGARILMLNGIESPGVTACSAIGEYVAQSLVPRDQYVKSPPKWVG